MKVIDQINGSALFAQSSNSASIATKDNLGRDITATYITGIDLSNYYTKDETSGAEQLAQAFSDIPGGGSVSSKYGTISVDGSNIEATNKAIEFKVNGFTSSFDAIVLDEYNPPRSITWYDYSQGTTLTASVMNHGNSDNLTYSSNTNVTGVITAAQWTPTNVSLSIPNATAIQFSADHSYDLQNIKVSASSSIKVKELAWKSDLPTYTYNSSNKLSAINGSALVGNEDYLVEQGFVQNLTSPKGTISVFNNNKIEGTNSAIASDVIEGFVSAYNGISVYPGNSATLSWANYVPNTVLHVSGAQGYPATYTYSADTGVTGQINLPNEGETSIEVPTNSTSIVIGTESWSNINLNFTVSAADYYEIGELAWASAIPTYEYDSTNKISAINGSALAGGSDVPSGTMNVSGLEYNAVNEISAYNGSAIAQYGAEKQWLQHDDTIVHVANSAQYAFGCNISALQRLMGIDETVLFETTSTSGSPMTDTFNLSGSMADYEKIKILYRPWNDSIIPEWFEFDYNKRGNTNIMRRCTTFTINPLRFVVCEFNFNADNSFSVIDVRFADSSFTTTSLDKSRGTIYKVIGIGRKA